MVIHNLAWKPGKLELPKVESANDVAFRVFNYLSDALAVLIFDGKVSPETAFELLKESLKQMKVRLNK